MLLRFLYFVPIREHCLLALPLISSNYYTAVLKTIDKRGDCTTQAHLIDYRGILIALLREEVRRQVNNEPGVFTNVVDADTLDGVHC